MRPQREGYVFHTYGPERFVRHAVASVVTLRRHDPTRPIALFCPPSHQEALESAGLDTLFQHIADLPAENQSIVGFKHHLHEFMPFDRCLFVDSDIIWCSDPEPIWNQLRAYAFTATGLERADFFFGGPKGWQVIVDVLLDRRGRTLRRFGLTHLPRVQAGMIYSGDRETTEDVCTAASAYLDRHDETHFRSRLNEGRSEESCEWSLAMAMSFYELPVFPWLQGKLSPQLDFVEGLTEYDPDFRDVSYRYYTDPFVYSLRGIPNQAVRDALIRLASSLPGRGDYQEFTPISLHFGWLHYKAPFYAFSQRIWTARSSYMEPVLAKVG